MSVTLVNCNALLFTNYIIECFYLCIVDWEDQTIFPLLACGKIGRSNSEA